MAKTQKFSEDKLLEAVIKYSELVETKIKATELAKWARVNIEGLEDVRDYHFTRPIREKNSKTGKLTEREKLCTSRINEINKSRSTIAQVNNNVLLRASHIEHFFDLPLKTQKKLIVETREAFNTLITKERKLTYENDALRATNNELKQKICSTEAEIDSIITKQSKLEKQINYLMKVTDEKQRKEMLAQMGITDGFIDLNQYKKCLENDCNRLFNIGEEIKQYNKEKELQGESLLDNILEGIDFNIGE